MNPLGRGVEALGSSWSFLDPDAAGTAGGLGGLTQGVAADATYEWWRLHDEY